MQRSRTSSMPSPAVDDALSSEGRRARPRLRPADALRSLTRGRVVLSLVAFTLLLAACGPIQEGSNAGVDPPPDRSAADLATVQARSFEGRPTATLTVREASRKATADARADILKTATIAVPPRVTPTPPAPGSMATVPAQPAPDATSVTGEQPVEPAATDVAGEPTPEPQPEQPEQPDAPGGDPLQAALLALEDLNGGPWTLDEQTALPYFSICDAWPIELIFPIEVATSVAYISSLSENLQEWVYWMPGEATGAMEYVHEYFSCRLADVYFYTDSMMELSDFPVLLPGDQTFAREFTITHADASYDPLYGHLIVTRVGEAVIALQFIGWENMDPMLVLQHVERAIERVKTLPQDAMPTPSVVVY